MFTYEVSEDPCIRTYWSITVFINGEWFNTSRCMCRNKREAIEIAKRITARCAAVALQERAYS